MSAVSRRTFQQTAMAAAAAATVRAADGGTSPADRVRLGFIGVGNRGDQVLDAFLAQPDADVVALCDLHAPYRDFAAAKVAQARGGAAPECVADYRRLLDRRDVDAVVIATPDHWHALQMIQACRAGKDVYVEKPLSLCVAEGRRMVEATGDRVVQVGIQRMSSPALAEVAELVRSGGIGKVTAARAFHVQNEWPKGIGRPADAEPPAGFDWDAWLGPAPWKPYNANRTFYRFRWFYDYSGGQVTNFGTHYLASIHRILGLEAPLSVTALGGRFAAYDNREVPDTLEVLWHYPGDTLVSFTQFNASSAPAAARHCEVEFRGTKGTLYLSSSGWELVPEVVTPNEFVARSPTDRARESRYRDGAKPLVDPRSARGVLYADTAHARDFLDAVRTRRSTSCPLEFAHRATSACILGNLALRTRTLLDWDAERERFTNSEAANALLDYDYRAPYTLDG